MTTKRFWMNDAESVPYGHPKCCNALCVITVFQDDNGDADDVKRTPFGCLSFGVCDAGFVPYIFRIPWKHFFT